MGEKGIDHSNGAQQIDSNRGLHVSQVCRISDVFGDHHSCHRHDDVEVGVFRQHTIPGLQNRIRFGYIDCDGFEIVDVLRVTSADHDGATRRCESSCQSEPDAGCSSDDENGAVRGIHQCPTSL